MHMKNDLESAHALSGEVCIDKRTGKLLPKHILHRNLRAEIER